MTGEVQGRGVTPAFCPQENNQGGSTGRKEGRSLGELAGEGSAGWGKAPDRSLCGEGVGREGPRTPYVLGYVRGK